MSAVEQSPAPQRSSRWLARDVLVIDNLLPDLARKQILHFLRRGHWEFGWKSKGSIDTFSFWHQHYAGHRHARQEKQYECSRELMRVPVLHWFWQQLGATPLFKGHSIVRCYANGQAYGSDGTLHTDSRTKTSLTTIYYPHDAWEANWAGETTIFNKEQDDIVASVYPRPNRLLIFPGSMPHVARGVSRTCPELRIVLVFKTDILPPVEKADDRGAAPEVPG